MEQEIKFPIRKVLAQIQADQDELERLREFRDTVIADCRVNLDTSRPDAVTAKQWENYLAHLLRRAEATKELQPQMVYRSQGQPQQYKDPT